MSGRVGLREERRAGRWLARRIARLFGAVRRRPLVGEGQEHRPWR